MLETPLPAKIDHPAGTVAESTTGHRWIERSLSRARDRLAGLLLRHGVRPNHLTVAGVAATLAASLCLAFGAGHRPPWEFAGAGPPVSSWPLAAGTLILLAGMMDVLDGATARVGRAGTAFGGILDSALDRISDMLVHGGCALYFAHVGNMTFVLLALLGMINAVLTSYIKARSESVFDDCEVGFWLRPERVVAFVFGCLTGHVPAMLVLLAVFPAFTVWRRLDHARRVCAAMESGQPIPGREPLGGGLWFPAPWRFPRGTIQYGIMALANAAFIVVGPWLVPFLSGRNDPIGKLMSSLNWA